MDIADQTQERIERLTEAEQRFGAAKPESPQPTGYCLNCGEPLADMRRWCSADCRDDWEWFNAHCL
ncbi:MAG: hypothetical protein LBU53_01125 [Zoogloeaceae bacterium]|jgi:hypothetical protein|nr:hypothetical protein [Zoogloeaceae bacterium]